MEYAVLLYFDHRTEKKIQEWMNQLVEAGVNRSLVNMDMRPHLTIAEVDARDGSTLEKEVVRLTDEINQYEIRLASLGFFPNDDGVLFMAPIVEEPLLIFHRKVHEALEPISEAFSPLYLEANWVPHCTLALELDEQQFAAAYKVMHKVFEPLTARIEDIGIFKCCPYREHMVRPILPKYKLNRDEADRTK